MPERLHGKRDLTVTEALEVVLIRRDQPALSGFLTRRDVERAAQVLADYVREQGAPAGGCATCWHPRSDHWTDRRGGSHGLECAAPRCGCSMFRETATSAS